MKTFKEYEEKVIKFAFYPGIGSFSGLVYAVLALSGEAGELANTLKKLIRDGESKMTPEWEAKLLDELGDVLWYVAATAREIAVDRGLKEVAEANYEKLSARHTKFNKVK